MKAIQISLLVLALSTARAATPSDPYFSQQWYLHNDGSQEVLIDIDNYHSLHQKGAAGVDIGWSEAQGLLANRAASPVTVAVIDTGIDPNHPDLSGRILPDGFNFLKDNPHNSPSVFDDIGHGTHVAGIIAANTDNRIGITGVTPSSVKILPLRVLSNNFVNFSFMGKLISNYAADAINYAVDHGAQVINMSFGWPKLVDTVQARKAVQNAIDKGVLIVAAAGNDRKSEPTYPCDYDGVLCVGAVTNTGSLTFFSNMGGVTDILAPGDSILSLYPLKVESRKLRIQGFENLSGTSQAAPLISGIAATLRSIYPDISLNELKARLFASGSELPQADAALYGLAHLDRAIRAQPQAVYVPEFKGVDAVSIDEASLTAQGQFTVTNLWAPAQNVKAQILINGKDAGDVSADQLASGGRLSVPWKYQFSSLEESSQLHFAMRVSDSTGKTKSFSIELPAVRSAEKVGAAQARALPPANWIGANLGKLYSRFVQVQDYPALPRLPAYYQIIGANGQGSSYQLFDPAQPNPLQILNVPGITVVGKVFPQVIRMDANGDGKLDWMVAGVAREKDQLYYQFYFVNSSLQPLWGNVDNSSWRVLVDSRYASMLPRNYAAPGSWIKSGDKLLPAFIDYGVLPDPDN
jgi:subtilisin family serine protease